jgi:hypothetical protein
MSGWSIMNPSNMSSAGKDDLSSGSIGQGGWTDIRPETAFLIGGGLAFGVSVGVCCISKCIRQKSICKALRKEDSREKIEMFNNQKT